ncbi:hypothetical protein Q8F55_007353 [Vanrija albida]|uniref:Aquaporin n=1 Tax=Vanrija albida TaxID=181172 RepID=A0ABR3PTA7_9TREE
MSTVVHETLHGEIRPVDPGHHGEHHHDHHGHHSGDLLDELNHEHGHEHELVGPGARQHDPVRYVLVTQDMLSQLNRSQVVTGHMPPGQTPGQYPPSSLDSSMVVNAKGEVVHVERAASSTTVASEPTYFPNPLAHVRFIFREYFGEFIGTMILIIFGNGVNCQVVLSDFTQGSYLSISFGWGIGVMFGIHACGGISGGHLNPAVTLAMAVFRGFPWRKVPGYALAQILGACLGSCLIQGNYHALLNKFEGGYNRRTYGLPTSTATLFFTDAQPYMSNVGSFFSEFFATAVLLGMILAVTDSNNNPAPAGLNGVIIMFLIVGIGAALGTETAYCLNPARDLGPRIACAMYGYPSRIWTYRHCYWIYVAIIGPLSGGLLGCFFYDLFCFSGEESPLNWKWGKFGKRKTDASPRLDSV